MNLAEALLAADAGKIKAKATKDFEVTRLSKLLGAPFVLHLREIDSKRVREFQDAAISFDKDGNPSTDSYKLQISLLVDGIVNEEFRDKGVLKHFNAATRKDLFEILFNMGEIQDISNEISKLCGFGNKDAVTEVKN